MLREQELIAAIKEADLNNVEPLIKAGVDLNYYKRYTMFDIVFVAI